MKSQIFYKLLTKVICPLAQPHLLRSLFPLGDNGCPGVCVAASQKPKPLGTQTSSLSWESSVTLASWLLPLHGAGVWGCAQQAWTSPSSATSFTIPGPQACDQLLGFDPWFCYMSAETL
jgi:hypothetical protein